MVQAPPRVTPPPPQPPSIVPQQLSPSEMQQLRRGATTRILHASDGAHQRLRTALLTRLASLVRSLLSIYPDTCLLQLRTTPCLGSGVKAESA